MTYFELLYNKYQKTTLTKKEVAKELGISEATFNRKLYSGEIAIPYMNTGNKFFFTLRGFADFLEAYEVLAA